MDSWVSSAPNVLLRAELWLPLLSLDTKLVSWCPQRLPELLPSTVSNEVKLEEAGNVANALASRFLADDKSKAAVKSMCICLHFGLLHVSVLGKPLRDSLCWLVQVSFTRGPRAWGESDNESWFRENIFVLWETS